MAYRFPICLFVSPIILLILSGPSSAVDEPNYLSGDRDKFVETSSGLPQRLPLVDHDDGIASLPQNSDLRGVEVIIERFADRRVKIKREVTQDSNFNYVNHGSWTEWGKNGEKVAEGSYRLGQRHGTWTRWHTVREFKSMNISTDLGFVEPIVSTAKFVDGEINGTWTLTDSEGRTIASCDFDHGHMHGTNVVWYSNGTKQFEVTYDQGALHGVLREWNTDGKLLKKRKFTNGREYVVHRETYQNGHLKVEGTLLKAKHIPQTNVDWWNGQVKTKIVDMVGSDERNGTWVFHYDNGEKQLEMKYKNNEPMGRIAGWFSNGQQSVVGHYIDGKQHGKWTWWHENGQKKIEGKFQLGSQLGNWIQWNEDGKVVYVEFHAHPEQSDAIDSDETTTDSLSLNLSNTKIDGKITKNNSEDGDNWYAGFHAKVN